jgi:hypothetical protein
MQFGFYIPPAENSRISYQARSIAPVYIKRHIELRYWPNFSNIIGDGDFGTFDLPSII